MDRDEYSKLVIDWLTEHTKGDLACPVCGTDTWVVGPMGDIPTRVELGEFFKGKVIPVVPVNCDNCAYTILFNAIKIGATPPDPEESES